MAAFKQAGTLDKTIFGIFDKIQNHHLWKISYQRIKFAEDVLFPHSKNFMPEGKIRELIHQCGIRTYPRPHGIPDNFKVRITDKEAGMEYVHPTDNQIRIRVMPGKPHSPNPCQKNPYAIQMKNGMAFDKFGNKVNKSSAEAHIPLNKFIYRN